MVSATAKKIAHAAKPRKPYQDFPLFAHPTGQWCKKIRGKHVYFGVWADPEAALNRYLDERDDLQAGRTPNKGDGLTIKELVNSFLTAKKRRVDSAELSPRTFADYHSVCEQFIDVLGKTSRVASLDPTDFDRLRAEFAKTHGPHRLTKDVTYVRTLLRFADDTFGIRVRHGAGFKRPSKTVMRKNRRKKAARMFTAEDLRAILEIAGVQLRAMIFLGVNCAMGNTDCAMLTRSVIDLKRGWITYPRPKTGVERRAALWPETIDAVRAAIAARPEPKDGRHKDRVFITKYGSTWEPKSISDSPVTKEFSKLLIKLGIHQEGVNFYALRHVFQTIAQRSRDKDAVRLVMGHAEASDDMSAIYSEESPDDARLRAVANYVRAWLFPSRDHEKNRK